MFNRPEDRSADLVFPVLSDVHIKRAGTRSVEKMRRALQQLNEASPRQDAIVFVGDMTDYGTGREYDRFHDVLNAGKISTAVPLFAIGNHEYLSHITDLRARRTFLNKTSMPAVYYHTVLKGYSFIVLGSEKRSKHGVFSEGQIDWLEAELQKAAARDRHRPIFVFVHQPVPNTVYGSRDWGIRSNADRLYRVMKRYPQLVLFSGHSHYPLEDARSIHQRHFTAVGTSSVSYMELERGKLQGRHPEGYEDFSQGLLVEVFGGEVVIHRRSFLHDDWIGSPWIIPAAPEQSRFLYKERPASEAPEFPVGGKAAIAAGRTGTSRLAVEFPQAHLSDGVVHSYRIVASERKTGKMAAAAHVFSEFYKKTPPAALVVPLSRLKPDTEYDITVTAVDCFGRESTRPLTAFAKTKSKFRLLRMLESLVWEKKEASSLAGGGQ